MSLPHSFTQHLLEEVKSHKAQIEAVKARGGALKEQGSPEDKKMVDRWIGDLLKRFDDLNFIMEEKKVKHQSSIHGGHRWWVVISLSACQDLVSE